MVDRSGLRCGVCVAAILFAARAHAAEPPAISADAWDLALEAAVAEGHDHPGRAPIRLASGEVVPLAALEPAAPAIRGDKPGVVVDRSAIGAPGLLGKAVYVSQCHGWMYFDGLGGFSTQRPVLHHTVEDFHNPEGSNAFLIPYLENAGAAVYTARERHASTRMAIADNDSDGYEESGVDFVDGGEGFAQVSPLPYGVDPFDAGTTRRFPSNGGGVATWSPDVPAPGSYGVYVSWRSDPSHASDAHYRVTHPGGAFERRFDQRVHGSTWQWLGEVWLAAPGDLRVELLSDSADDAWLSADAVRIGGGIDDVVRRGATTGRPRWEASAIHYAQFNGAPTWVYDPNDNGIGTDHMARALWADWEHPDGEDAVYLSWHSNAFDGSARGTMTFFAGGAGAPSELGVACSHGTPAVPGSYDLARHVQGELIDSLRTRWDPDWKQRGHDGLSTACFSEVNPALNEEMPSVLVELAFHDNAEDAAHLLHPVFRRDAARAMVHGLVRYFAERDGVSPVFAPEPPVGLLAVREGDSVRVTWEPGPVGHGWGDQPTGWTVEVSPDAKNWSAVAQVDVAEAILPLDPGEMRWVRVRATNAGGRSFPSTVVGARGGGVAGERVLVVAGFDRFDRGLLRSRTVPALGSLRSLDPPRMNDGTAAAVQADALARAGAYVDIVQADRFPAMALDPYGLVVWVAGEQSTADGTIDPAAQDALRAWVASGGALIVSGAEVLWDLDAHGTAVDRAFAHEVLGATYAADDAGTSEVAGEGVLDGLTLDFGEDVGAMYPVEWPDELASSRPVIARYAHGGVAGVLDGGVAFFGFPLETIAHPWSRVHVFEALLRALQPAAALDPWDGPPLVEPDVPFDLTLDSSAPDEESDADDALESPRAVDTGLPAEGEKDQVSPPSGGGCAHVGPSGAVGVGLFAGLAVRRRRRPSGASRPCGVLSSGPVRADVGVH